jgi:hypothetical protein
MAWPHVFGAESGNVAASQLDDNFGVAAFASDVTALSSTVAALPSSNTPLVPVASGSPGSSPTLSRDDHQHPPQPATPNVQTGTSYTITSANDGQVTDIANAGAITVTLSANTAASLSGLVTQAGAGQITFVAGSGASFHQRSGFTKTAGQWAVVSWYVRTNSGGSAAEYVLSGDMA